MQQQDTLFGFLLGPFCRLLFLHVSVHGRTSDDTKRHTSAREKLHL
jgi:hypothetical protein